MKVALTIIAIVLIWWGEAAGLKLPVLCGAMCAIAAVLLIIQDMRDDNNYDNDNNATSWG
jgi:hypothetical protein